MPDLLKNADKHIILHPEKLQHQNQSVNMIISGWNRHLDVDRYFHSSDFFIHHSHQLKLQLLPVLNGSPVKPFFLGHVGLELVLDNLLLTKDIITTDSFYRHLEGCSEFVINEFLNFAGLEDTGRFLKFYDDFKRSRYLDSYLEINAVGYALKRICMRVWKDPFNEKQEADMNTVLKAYREHIENNFMQIFDEIDVRL